MPTKDEELSKVARIVNFMCDNLKGILVGSRRLTLAKENSDWNIIFLDDYAYEKAKEFLDLVKDTSISNDSIDDELKVGVEEHFAVKVDDITIEILMVTSRLTISSMLEIHLGKYPENMDEIRKRISTYDIKQCFTRQMS